MTAALYEDAGLTLDEHGITIRRYYFPFATPKRASGKGRFWGASDPRYWFSVDSQRGSKPTLLILDLGRRVKPCITPENPDSFIELLKSRVS